MAQGEMLKMTAGNICGAFTLSQCQVFLTYSLPER